MLAGLLILFYQNDIFDASSVAAATLTYTLTLGVMASFMLGALWLDHSADHLCLLPSYRNVLRNAAPSQADHQVFDDHNSAFAPGQNNAAASFALSIVFAMLHKIVPFLTWFHLNAQGYFTAPMMHEVIHPKTAKKRFWIHLAAIATLILSLLVEQVIFVSGALTILSFGWVAWQITHAHLLYRKTEATGEKFDMGNMGS